jgi:hypothetical protein
MRKSKTNCPVNKTEKAHLLEMGYSRIWDCGKIRWIYKIL